MSNNELNEILQLQSIEAGSKTFGEWLAELPSSPEMAETAPALIDRTNEKVGVVDFSQIPDASDPVGRRRAEERRDYLRSLVARRIIPYKAFDHVRGAQVTVNRIIQHEKTAADGGYPLRQGILVLGGPGSGKGFLSDSFKALLEGVETWVVEGCPVHENPINLLKLLPREKLEALAAKLGMEAILPKLLAVAGDPCKHCWEKVMLDSEGKALPAPNLAGVTCQKLRMSSRTFGIATWEQNAEGCSLTQALRQGSGGIVDIPELCAVQHAADGETLQIEVLINATDARRIPDTGNCGQNAGYLPINAQILCQSNLGAWEEFLKGQKDPDKFTRRFAIFALPYITARIEEELAYADMLAGLKVKPKFDPLALKIAATLAVLSRLKKVEGLRVIDKVRLLNGEAFVVSREKPVASSSYSGGYNAWGTSQSRTSSTESSAPTWSQREIGEMLDKGDKADEKDREGLSGLTMPFMLGFIGQVASQYAKAPRHPAHPDREPVVTSIDMIKLLRAKLASYRQTIGLTEQQKKMIDTCLTEYLKEAPTTSDTPGVLELEYRRLLREQLLDVFAPDFEKNAQEIFVKYRLHARAYGNSDSKLKLPGTVNQFIDVDVKFLDSVDKGRSLKSELGDVRSYRGSLDAQINDLSFSKGTLVSEDADKVKALDWTTIPELKKAIEDRLYEIIGERVEKVLNSKQPDLLSDDDRDYLEESLKRFRDLGYDETSLERALEYAKELRLWAKPVA